MIYTLRTFQVEPKHTSEFVRLCEEKAWPVMEDKGALPIALWKRAAGGDEHLLQMVRYGSLAHWQEIKGWHRNGGRLTQIRSEQLKLVTDTAMIVLSPLTRRQPEGDGPESEPGIYTMRRFTVERGNIRRLSELSEDGWWPWVTQGQGIRPLGQWVSTVAPETQIYMIARYDDLAHWEATRGPGPEPEDPELRDIWEKGSKELKERSDMTLHTDVCVLRLISRRKP